MKKRLLILFLIVFTTNIFAIQTTDEDMGKFTRLILETYLKECYENKIKRYPPEKYPNRWDKNALCGLVATNRVRIEPRKQEGDIIEIESTVYMRSREEFQDPEKNYLERELELFGSKLVKACSDTCKEKETKKKIVIDKNTKCEVSGSSVYCHTSMTPKDIREIMFRIEKEMLRLDKEPVQKVPGSSNVWKWNPFK